MIQQTDPDGFERCFGSTCGVDVLAGGGDHTGRVVMRRNDGHSLAADSGFDDLADGKVDRIDIALAQKTSVNPQLLLAADVQDLASGIQTEEADALLLLVAEFSAEILPRISRAADVLPVTVSQDVDLAVIAGIMFSRMAMFWVSPASISSSTLAPSTAGRLPKRSIRFLASGLVSFCGTA